MRSVAVLCGALLCAVSGCAADPSVAPSVVPTQSQAEAPTPSPSPSPTPSPTPAPRPDTPDRVQGIDVSAYQPTVDWPRWRRGGVRFVWIKASEGTTWTNRYFTGQRDGARSAGLYQGAYHYARPANSSGQAQARHFVASGGAWTDDGQSLPGALDLKKNPSGAACYGKNPEEMVAWVRDFTTTYRELSGRDAVIYVRADWWRDCTGDDTSFAGTNPLWLYDHDAPMGPLPAGWTRPQVWQYAARDGMDRNVFLGSIDDLASWAAGHDVRENRP